MIPPPREEDLKALAGGFALRTCQPDGFHPRQFQLLTQGTLRLLGKLAVRMWIAQEAPASLRELQVLLARKANGQGRRPIGFFPAFVRFGGKVLASQARAWEQEHGCGASFSMLQGRSPCDTVWRQATRAERASATRQHTLSLLDLKPFYEQGGLDLLRQCAEKVMHPLANLESSPAPYRQPRRLGGYICLLHAKMFQTH